MPRMVSLICATSSIRRSQVFPVPKTVDERDEFCAFELGEDIKDVVDCDLLVFYDRV